MNFPVTKREQRHWECYSNLKQKKTILPEFTRMKQIYPIFLMQYKPRSGETLISTPLDYMLNNLAIEFNNLCLYASFILIEIIEVENQ